MGNRCCAGEGAPVTLNDEAQQPLAYDDEAFHPEPAFEAHIGGRLAQGEDDLDEEEKASFARPQKCTDAGCCLVFAGCLVCLAFALQYALEHGDIRRLHHGMDWDGNLCGVDAAVADKPYLYWCSQAGDAMSYSDLLEVAMQAVGQDGQNLSLSDLVGELAVHAVTDTLDLGSPVCVSSCPDDDGHEHACYQGSQLSKFGDNTTGDFTRNVTYDFAFVQDYASFSFGPKYCFPRDQTRLKQLESLMTVGVEYVVFHSGELAGAWQPLAASVGFAVVCGYAYLFLVKTLAAPIVYTTIALATLLPIAGGVIGFYSVFNEDFDTLLQTRYNVTVDDLQEQYDVPADAFLVTTGSRKADMGISAALIVLGLAVAMTACCMRKKILLVLGALAAAFDCMWDMPSMLWHPLAIVFPRVVYCGVALAGFLWMLTIGEVSRYDPHDAIPSGILRMFEFSAEDVAAIAVYCFMVSWGLELIVAVDQFVFGYVTQRWYFTEYDRHGHKSVPRLIFVKGYYIALVYHLGSLLYGSLLLSALRLFTWIMNYVIARVEDATDNDKANGAIDCIAGACCCCMECWEGLIRFLNKEAYLVVAVKSYGFCDAAELAFNIMVSEIATVGALQGATGLFQVGGLVTITSASSCFAWLLCRHVPGWSDPDSAAFIAAPEIVAVTAGVLSLLVALCFTFVFDTVTDTMLFCWALEQRERKSGDKGRMVRERNNVPPRLAALLGHNDPQSRRLLRR